MISWGELRTSLNGAFLLARWDLQGLRYMDTSPAGALRSFWLALYQLPLVAFLDWGLLKAGVLLLQDGNSAGAVVLLGWLATYGFGWAVGVWYVMLILRLSVPPALQRAALAAVLSVSNWLAAFYTLIATGMYLAAPLIGSLTAALANTLLFFYLFVIMGFAFFRIFNGNLRFAVVLVLGSLALSLYVGEQNSDLIAYLKQAG